MQDRKSILICVFKKETAKMTHVYSLYFPERFWFTETCVGRPENCWGATNLVLHLILTANSACYSTLFCLIMETSDTDGTYPGADRERSCSFHLSLSGGLWDSDLDLCWSASKFPTAVWVMLEQRVHAARRGVLFRVEFVFWKMSVYRKCFKNQSTVIIWILSWLLYPIKSEISNKKTYWQQLTDMFLLL